MVFLLCLLVKGMSNAQGDQRSFVLKGQAAVRSAASLKTRPE